MAENSLTAWVDAACDRLEQGWKAGSPPAVEELMADSPADARRHALAELVALDQEYRAKAERPLTRDEAFARFAGLGPWAEPVLSWAFPLPPVLTVEVTAGPHAGERFELTGHDGYTVGRQPGLAVSLSGDGYLSRVHVLLAVAGGTVRVMDLGSKGGTHVGGERVPQWDFAGGGAVRLGKQTELRLAMSGATFDATVSFGGAPGGSAPAATLPAGRPAIPGYDLGDELGRGAMGVVYRAVRRSTGEAVALKTILPAVAPTRTMVGRFCREADLLAKLSHPNVVGFRESGAAGGVLFVAMEFVPGRSTADVSKVVGPLAPGRARRWADQLLAGLSHAHAAKVVHRDVKPANLLVSGDGEREVLKVADFGLARAYESSGASGLTADGTTCGTLAYMPPEQVTDVKRVGPAADQYAAAATLYHLLTGQPVYPSAKTAQAQVGQLLSDDPLPLRADAPPLPEPFDRVLRKALARDPAARYPSCEAMRQDLLRG